MLPIGAGDREDTFDVSHYVDVGKLVSIGSAFGLRLSERSPGLGEF